MTHPVPVIFDLDGVMVDNCHFERRVASLIVDELARQRDWSLERAESEWNACLERHRDNVRWHDYSFHCEKLGLGEIWKRAHIESRQLLSSFPQIQDVLKAVSMYGEPWIASDATSWVIRFKLETVGIAMHRFVEIFSLDRCGVAKKHDDYWLAVRDQLASRESVCVYIDNRLDLLAHASSILPHVRPIWLPTPDHPQSLGFANDLVRSSISGLRQASLETLCIDVMSAMLD